MNIKDRAMAALRGDNPDMIPFLIYSGILPRGSVGRKLRNMGLGLCVHAPVYWVETRNVMIEQNARAIFLLIDDLSKNSLFKSYHTPVGSVSAALRTDVSQIPFTKEHVIKDLPDYEVVKYIIENTEFHPDYEAFRASQGDLGDDGIVAAFVERSPLQKALIELMGYERFSIDLYRHPKEFEDLLRTIEKKEDELYRIVADSPAEIVWCPDNINGIVTSPRLFEKYCIPFYNRQAQLLHKKGKILEVHMDGKLKCLRDLIAKTDVDVVEAFTPPPMGDLPLDEARSTWGRETVIWVNFPGSVFMLGEKAVRRLTIELLRSIAPGERFVMGVTEDIAGDTMNPYMATGLATVLKTVRKHGRFPVSSG